MLSRQLVEADQTVVDVPAKLAARVRTLSGAGHKTDAHDARSVAVAGRHATTVLRPVVADGAPELFGLLVERRWQIVSARQKTLVRIHEQLTKLIPGGYPKQLTAYRTGRLLATIRTTDPVSKRRRQVVLELLRELRTLDRKRTTINAELDQALADYGTCLTDIDGVGRVAAATIIAIVGDVHRFPTAGHFASFTGTAPIAASSGDVIRYRLNRGGHRQLNKVLHTAAKVQTGMKQSAGRAYIHRRLAEGKTRAEATRALKRHLSNAVYRALLADALTREVSGEDIKVA